MSDPTPVIETRSLAVSLDGRWIIRDLDIAFHRGEFVAVVGRNGAGKTTLLRALAGLAPSFGRISVSGAAIDSLDPRTRARAIAYLPQGHIFHWPMPVEDVVALGRMPHGAGVGSLSVQDRDAVDDALNATGMGAFADRAVTALSGGERARVAVARVLAVEAPVILADEPTASLDPRYQLLVLDLLRQQADRGVAVVGVLHDLSLASRFADRMIVMEAGQVVADGPPAEVLTDDLLRRVFGVAGAVVEKDGRRVVLPWSLADGD